VAPVHRRELRRQESAVRIKTSLQHINWWARTRIKIIDFRGKRMPILNVIKGPMKGETFRFSNDTIFIGRSAKNDFQVKDGAISRKQVKIFNIGSKLFVEDLKSTNGTMINGEVIVSGEGFEVNVGDTISMGNTVIRFEDKPSSTTFSKTTLLPQGTMDIVPEKKGLPQERRSRTSRDLELIFNITEMLRHSLNLEDMLKKVLDFLFESLPRIDRAAIVLFDDNEGQIKDMLSKSREDVNSDGVSYSRSIMDRVIRDGKAIRMSDTNYEPQSTITEDMNTLLIRSVLCVPMISNQKTRGAIYVDSLRGPYGFRKEDLLLLNSMTGPIAVAIENAQLSLGQK
jgi:pSer/pThr/pTyr-binding forkhead associated (FHA) protein